VGAKNKGRKAPGANMYLTLKYIKWLVLKKKKKTVRVIQKLYRSGKHIIYKTFKGQKISSYL
jgi:hypothetical protein